ncbi:MAG: DUF2062 domain-containing protein [Syntrophales bacterium]|nr:DUF2062 domain-containing protein [Syntrophales bacterium]HPL63612.1 DUF2062 domain-containing protein [Syntrophales bacterium]
MLKEKLREFYRRFISLKGEPRSIAMGMAIGVFVGVTPTIPFHTVIITALIFISRQNLTAAMIGAWITNPVTLPLFYFAEYEIGRMLLGWERTALAFGDYGLSSLLGLGMEILYPLQVGGIVLAPFFAVPAYFLTYRAVAAIRRKRADDDPERTAEKV